MAKPEDLGVLFRSLKSLLLDFESPAPGVLLESRSASDREWDLWSVRPVVIDGRAKKELFFAGIRLQKSFVGFYFFPLYCLPTLTTSLAPALTKLLSGKSCFRLTTLDGGVLEHLRNALALGIEVYRAQGWA